jgi:hypothetical protein
VRPNTHAHIVCKSDAMKRLVLFHVISSALHGFRVSPAAARQPAKQVRWAANAAPSTVEHMRVDHGGANVLVGRLSVAVANPYAPGSQQKKPLPRLSDT